MTRNRKRAVQDLFLLIISIGVAVLLVKTGLVHTLVESVSGVSYLGSFLAGLFFTSMFTTAPAIAVLGELAQMNALLGVAFFGAIGAMIGDYLLYCFVRDRISKDIEYLMCMTKIQRVPALFKTQLFRYAMPFFGALIIASPLPDELGLTLLGLSKVKRSTFLPIVFTFNFLGIIAIGLIARATMW